MTRLEEEEIPFDGIPTLSKALCCWVRGFVCTNAPSYAGSSIAAGRATHTGQVSKEVPD
jgi:hypothetical protein